MRVAEQQCKVKHHNCQIMYPEQRPYSHLMCFCQKNSKWLSKIAKVRQQFCLQEFCTFLLSVQAVNESHYWFSTLWKPEPNI